MNKLLINAAKGCLWITAGFAAVVLLPGLSYGADIAAHGKQTRARGGIQGELSGEGFTVPSGQTGSITGAECDGAGFWVDGGGAGVRNFRTVNAAIGAIFAPGSYSVYPYLKPEQDIAVVTITVRVFGTTTAGRQSGGGAFPLPGPRRIQVRPQVSAQPEVLTPGMYNVWVRIGDFAPGKEADSNKVTTFEGGTWKRYPKVDFSAGGKPHHITIFPDQVRDTIYYKDLNNPSYRTPKPNEFILHFENRSLKDTVTYVFEPTGAVGSSHPSPSGGVPTTTTAGSNRGTSPFDGLWHTTRQHSGCCSYSATEDITFTNDANGVTSSTNSGLLGAARGRVTGKTLTLDCGIQNGVVTAHATFTLAADGRSFSGNSSNKDHRATVRGSR